MMTDYVKKIIDSYREKTAQPSRSEVVSFRVTPDELDLLMRVYGGYTGIRDFALASTDNNFVDDVLEDEDEIRS
jgi:hypothetical protein